MSPDPVEPEQPFEPEEALELVGVEVPASDEATWLEMARCFIEEYVRMGRDAETIMGLCRNPFYRGLHALWQRKGEAFIRTLITDSMQQWRPSDDHKEST